MEGQRIPMPEWAGMTSGQGLAFSCPCEQVEELVALGLALMDCWLQLPPAGRGDQPLDGQEAQRPPGTLLTHAGPVYLPPLAALTSALGPEFHARLTDALRVPTLTRDV